MSLAVFLILVYLLTIFCLNLSAFYNSSRWWRHCIRHESCALPTETRLNVLNDKFKTECSVATDLRVLYSCRMQVTSQVAETCKWHCILVYFFLVFTTCYCCKMLRDSNKKLSRNRTKFKRLQVTSLAEAEVSERASAEKCKYCLQPDPIIIEGPREHSLRILRRAPGTIGGNYWDYNYFK